jgi:hypothetical protein
MNASDFHVGGVTQQKSGDHWRPLGFLSKKLSEREPPYSTFDWELLAEYLSIRHFRHFYENCLFQLWADHKPLVTALYRVTAPIRHANKAIWRSLLSSMCKCLNSLACKTLSLIFCPIPLCRPNQPVMLALPQQHHHSILRKWQNTAQKRSACSVEHLLPLLSNKLANTTYLGCLNRCFTASSSDKNYSKIFFPI